MLIVDAVVHPSNMSPKIETTAQEQNDAVHTMVVPTLDKLWTPERAGL